MSEVLGEVISSTPIDDDICPRTYLGLSCMKPTYDCVCEHIRTCDLEITRNDEHVPAVVQLRLELTGSPKAVMSHLNHTRFRADYEASAHRVIATFNLRRVENHDLREFILSNEV